MYVDEALFRNPVGFAACRDIIGGNSTSHLARMKAARSAIKAKMLSAPSGSDRTFLIIHAGWCVGSLYSRAAPRFLSFDTILPLTLPALRACAGSTKACSRCGSCSTVSLMTRDSLLPLSTPYSRIPTPLIAATSQRMATQSSLLLLARTPCRTSWRRSRAAKTRYPPRSSQPSSLAARLCAQCRVGIDLPCLRRFRQAASAQV